MVLSTPSLLLLAHPPVRGGYSGLGYKHSKYTTHVERNGFHYLNDLIAIFISLLPLTYSQQVVTTQYKQVVTIQYYSSLIGCHQLVLHLTSLLCSLLTTVVPPLSSAVTSLLVPSSHHYLPCGVAGTGNNHAGSTFTNHSLYGGHAGLKVKKRFS